MGARLTRFSPASELSRLNRSAGTWVDIGPELAELLRISLRSYEASFGLVNVAVLSSMVAIGYDRPLSAGLGVATLERATPLQPLTDVLELRGSQARLRPGSGIDLGGIAKGWIADRLCERLGPNALANIGGDLYASGSGPRDKGWAVGLAGATVILRDQGAATSSVRKRRWGAALHHLIDPRTGLSSQSGLSEVSVVAESAVSAEVVAKTALLLGPDVAPAYCACSALAWSLSDDD